MVRILVETFATVTKKYHQGQPVDGKHSLPIKYENRPTQSEIKREAFAIN